ncbi:MAG: hypothetical protein ACFFD4_12735, partial [Candidatus Odinarchaeota archaeon]
STISIQASEISNNDMGGVYLIDTETVEINYCKIVSNKVFAINATSMGTGRTVDASNNYWGTLDSSEIVNHGSVDIDPILDQDMKTTTTQPSSSSHTTAKSTSGFSSVEILTILSLVGIIGTIKKKKKLKG